METRRSRSSSARHASDVNHSAFDIGNSAANVGVAVAGAPPRAAAAAPGFCAAAAAVAWLLLVVPMLPFVPGLSTVPGLSAALEAQQLTETEERIVAGVEPRVGDAIDLLERTVNVNSGTLNVEGVREVAGMMRPGFEELGFDVRWIELPEETERAGHLVAEHRGDGAVRLLLIGHLDTVFEEDSPFQEYEYLGDGVARGPGVSDMKGGNVVILLALQALHAAGALDGVDVTVFLTGDEESPGRPLEVSRGDFVEAGEAADVALGFEAASRDDEAEYAVIARRSFSSWRLEVEAHTAHSSGIFREGVGAGAAYEAARILNAFYEDVRGEEDLTFSPGLLAAGAEVELPPEADRGTLSGKTNIIPARAVAEGDLRALSVEQLERAREAMRAVVEEGSLPGASAEIHFREGYPPMSPTDENRVLLGLLNEVSADLGTGEILPFDPGLRGAADISFVAPYVEAGLDGLGPHGSGAHTAEETVDLRSIPVAAKRAALLIHRLSRDGLPF